MGFISNQWLNRGMGLRSRSYRPVPVTIACNAASDAFSRGNEVVIRFTAENENGEYQTLHLSPVGSGQSRRHRRLRPCLRRDVRSSFPGLLRDLTDAKLLSLLASDLKKTYGELALGS